MADAVEKTRETAKRYRFTLWYIAVVVTLSLILQAACVFGWIGR